MRLVCSAEVVRLLCVSSSFLLTAPPKNAAISQFALEKYHNARSLTPVQSSHPSAARRAERAAARLTPVKVSQALRRVPFGEAAFQAHPAQPLPRVVAVLGEPRRRGGRGSDGDGASARLRLGSKTVSGRRRRSVPYHSAGSDEEVQRARC